MGATGNRGPEGGQHGATASEAERGIDDRDEEQRRGQQVDGTVIVEEVLVLDEEVERCDQHDQELHGPEFPTVDGR